MKEQDLLNLKKKQDEASKKIDNLKGQEESILQQLRDQWECQEEQEAESQINQFDSEKQQLQSQYDKGTEELEKWLEEQGIDVNDD